MDTGNTQPAETDSTERHTTREDEHKGNCMYCDAAAAGKSLGLSGEHSLHGLNKEPGNNTTSNCCHG